MEHFVASMALVTAVSPTLTQPLSLVFVTGVIIIIVCNYFSRNQQIAILNSSIWGIIVSQLYRDDKPEFASLIVLIALYVAFIKHVDRYLTLSKILVFVVMIGFNLTLVT